MHTDKNAGSRIGSLYALLQGVIGFERKMLTTNANTSY